MFLRQVFRNAGSCDRSSWRFLDKVARDQDRECSIHFHAVTPLIHTTKIEREISPKRGTPCRDRDGRRIWRQMGPQTHSNVFLLPMSVTPTICCKTEDKSCDSRRKIRYESVREGLRRSDDTRNHFSKCCNRSLGPQEWSQYCHTSLQMIDAALDSRKSEIA